MSLSLVRPYFRTRLDGLGYEEWDDGFDFQNIPESIIDGSYHLTTGEITRINTDHQVTYLSYPVFVRLYFDGFRNPKEAIDEAVEQGETIISDIISIANSNAQGIKDVQFDSMEPAPKGITNDNIILLDMAFSARVVIDRR